MLLFYVYGVANAAAVGLTSSPTPRSRAVMTARPTPQKRFASTPSMNRTYGSASVTAAVASDSRMINVVEGRK